MSTARIHNLDLTTPAVAQTIQQRSLLVGGVFGIASAICAWVSPDQFFRAYLLGYMAWLGVTLGCMALLMVQHLTGGAWGLVIRRPLEAGMRTLPLMAGLFVPLVIGMHHLYPWTNPAQLAGNKRALALTHSYLTPAGFIGRAVLYFAIWGALMYFLSRRSAEQDNPPDRELSFRGIGGPGLVLYPFSVTFAVIDWVMSLDPGWISTIYGLVFVVGQCLSALCFMVIVERILFNYEPTSKFLKANEVQDHGKLILTFVMLWAYFGFSQLLIIWAGNLPEEITWYVRRLNNGWQWVGLFLAAFHFVLPFILLLSRPFKRRVQSLVLLAMWLMVMRYVDLFWYIDPNFHSTFYLNWLDIVIPFAIGGFWLALFFHNLRQRPLLPLHDPRIHELLEPAHE